MFVEVQDFHEDRIRYSSSMLDPLTSLAFSVYSGKGVYALLLGSGVSRAASIPTGWEVTLDLVRQLAASCEEECSPGPEEWYREKFKREPDYSELLEQVALTPAERTNALAAYFEGTAEEREQGAKVPTKAHQAIADLVAKGYIRVIITTNFDRLMEQALTTEGVAATVISTDDMIRGAMPLMHSTCTVIKVHGDYRDTRFRNTSKELESYSPEMNALLDRVFDDYGVVVAGWSAAWDSALRAAFMRTPNRRFSMTWAAKGEMTREATEVANFRQAQVTQIESADEFFISLRDKITALERYHAPHPMSVDLAISSVKRFISQPQFRIELHDLFIREVDRMMSALSTNLKLRHNLTKAEEYDEVLKICEAESLMLRAMASTFGYFASSTSDDLLDVALIRLLTWQGDDNSRFMGYDPKPYTASLAFYSIGIAACAANRYTVLASLFRSAKLSSDSYNRSYDYFVEKVYAAQVLNGDAIKVITNQNLKFPASERVFTTIREGLRSLIPNDELYEDVFDRFEYLLALRIAELKLAEKFPRAWGPVGRFGYRKRESGTHVSKRLLDEIEQEGDRSPVIAQGLFASSTAYKEIDAKYREETLSRVSTW